jgi:hypothetical protein
MTLFPSYILSKEMNITLKALIYEKLVANPCDAQENY